MSATYTEEEKRLAIQLYQDQHLSIDEISKRLNKTKKSLIAKLVREKVYVKADKSNAKKTALSKKEIVRDLEKITGLQFEALVGANKSDLMALLSYIQYNASP